MSHQSLRELELPQYADTVAFGGEVNVCLLALLPGIYVLILQLAKYCGGSPAHDDLRGDDLTTFYNRAFGHNRIFTDLGVNAYDGAHTDVGAVTDDIAVDDGAVTYRDPLADIAST